MLIQLLSGPTKFRDAAVGCRSTACSRPMPIFQNYLVCVCVAFSKKKEERITEWMPTFCKIMLMKVLDIKVVVGTRVKVRRGRKKRRVCGFIKSSFKGHGQEKSIIGILI